MRSNNHTHHHLNPRFLAFCTVLLFVVGCSEKQQPQPDFWAAESAILDRDGTDGYSGDYILIYNPMSNSDKKSIGSADEIEKGAEPFRSANPVIDLPVDASLYAEADPFVTDSLRASQKNSDWTVGDQKIFKIREMPSGEMAFQVVSVGEHCCVWSPLNSAYGPLESINASFPALLASVIDEALPQLEEYYGVSGEIIHVLCHDLNSPTEYGRTSFWDLYNQCYTGNNSESIAGNDLPIIHINTAPLLVTNGDNILSLRDAAVHELTHLMLCEKLFPEGYLEGFITNGDHQNFYIDNIESVELLGELLAMAAQETVYPGSALEQFLPCWYANGAVWADLPENDLDHYLRNGGSVLQNGGTLWRGVANREDQAALLLLAHFVQNRCGLEIFPNILAAWQKMGCTGDPVQAIWEAAGYSDSQTFFEEFLLSAILHDNDFADGKYRLEAFDGYEGDDPFSSLRPIVTETQLSVKPGGYIIICPSDGTYFPPETAGQGLVYIGIRSNKP